MVYQNIQYFKAVRYDLIMTTAYKSGLNSICYWIYSAEFLRHLTFHSFLRLYQYNPAFWEQHGRVAGKNITTLHN